MVRLRQSPRPGTPRARAQRRGACGGRGLRAVCSVLGSMRGAYNGLGHNLLDFGRHDGREESTTSALAVFSLNRLTSGLARHGERDSLVATELLCEYLRRAV